MFILELVCLTLKCMNDLEPVCLSQNLYVCPRTCMFDPEKYI